MSLISEALKEAQRSHSQRLTPKSPAPVGEAFFPYPEGRKPVRSLNRAFLIGGIAVAVLVVGAAVVARMRIRPSPIVPISHAPPVVNTPTAAPLPSAPVPATASPSVPVAVPVVTAPARAAADTRSAPAKPNNTPANPAPQTASAPVQPTTRAPIDPAPARSLTPPATPAPPALPPTQTQGAASAGVHVVLDAGSSRSGDSLFKQAYAEQLRGNFGRSKELYEKAIALPQASGEAFNNYGVLLLQTGDQVGASEMFKQAVKRDDKNVDAWINLGDSYNAIGHHADAIGAFARAGQLDASNSALAIRMAAEYQAIGDTAGARRKYDDAIRQSPRDPSVHYNFAKFLQTQRDFRGAIREYQAFVDLAPGKFSAEQIASIRQYIITLGRYLQ